MKLHENSKFKLESVYAFPSVLAYMNLYLFANQPCQAIAKHSTSLSLHYPRTYTGIA